MNFLIKKLKSDMAEDFTAFFDRLKFEHSPNWASCFCQFYQTDCAFEEWIACSAETNKERAIEAIQKGTMQGYLAFEGEKVIGWLNANEASSYPRLKEDVAKLNLSGPWGLTICFVIDPEYRHKGLATALLAQAIEGFKSLGYNGALAFPVIESPQPEKHYRGRISTYAKAGYEKIGEEDGIQIMRLVF